MRFLIFVALLVLATASGAVLNRGSDRLKAGSSSAALLPHRLAAEAAAPAPVVSSSSSSSSSSGVNTTEQSSLSARSNTTLTATVTSSNSTNLLLRNKTTVTNGTTQGNATAGNGTIPEPATNATTGTNRTAPITSPNATNATAPNATNATDVVTDEDRTIPDTKYILPQELLQRNQSYNFCCCSCGGKNETRVHFAKSAHPEANRLCGQGFCQYLFPTCNSSGFSWKSHMLMYDEPETVVKNLINSCWLRAERDGAHMHLLQRHVSVTKQAVNNATDYLIRSNRD